MNRSFVRRRIEFLKALSSRAEIKIADRLDKSQEVRSMLYRTKRRCDYLLQVIYLRYLPEVQEFEIQKSQHIPSDFYLTGNGKYSLD